MQSQKECLIEKYRDCLTDYNWWEGIYEDFEAKCIEQGITIFTHQETYQVGAGKSSSREVKEIQWSGFWSQGDGACFEGKISDLAKFLTYNQLNYPLMSQMLSFDGLPVSCCWYHSGHYYHSNSLSYSVDHEDYFLSLCPTDDDEDLRYVVAQEMDYLLDVEVDKFDDDVRRIVKDLCDDLYSDLYKEYEYLTSDEAVWEFIVNNELDNELIAEEI